MVPGGWAAPAGFELLVNGDGIHQVDSIEHIVEGQPRDIGAKHGNFS